MASIESKQSWKFPRAAGDLDALECVTEPMPAPFQGQVQIGLNFADVFSCLGIYSATPNGSFTPGLECCGTVVAIGTPENAIVPGGGSESDKAFLTDEIIDLAVQRAQGLSVGDTVMCVTRFGSYSTALNVWAHQVRRKPDAWSDACGAAFLVQGLTSLYGLQRLGQLSKGDVVLVHSAAGGCGLHALGICRAAGATPIGTVGSESKADFLLGKLPWLKRDQIIVRAATPAAFAKQLAAALSAANAEGFDVILDAVAGSFFKPGYDSLARGGRYVVYGSADWTPKGDKTSWLRLGWQYLQRFRLDPLTMVSDNKGVLGFNLIWMFRKTDLLLSLVEQLTDMGLDAPTVGCTYPFSQLKEAVRKLQSGTTVGKVVVLVE